MLRSNTHNTLRSRGGKSKVLAHLNDESNRRVEFNRLNLYTDFDIAVEVCDITFAPIITGPQIDVTGGRATQSSTAAGAEGKLTVSVRFVAHSSGTIANYFVAFNSNSCY